MLTQKLLNKIQDNDASLSESQLRIIKFGLECLFSEFSKFIVYLIIFWAMSLLELYLSSVIVYCTIRAASGGYHAKSYYGCFVISFVIFLSCVMAGKYLLLDNNIKIALLIASIALNCYFAPVDHPNKPIKSATRRKKLKLISIGIASFWGLISFLFQSDISTTIMISVFLAAIMLPVGLITNSIEKKQKKVT
jgi:accessory gene regulator B